MKKRIFALVVGSVLLGGAPGLAETNDSHFDTLWGLRKIQAEKAWATSAGRGVVVAVIDTGVDFTHPDLRNRKSATYNCLGGKCVRHHDEGDNVGHGTHVAGTIAAETGNGVGVASVAPEAKILSMLVCTADGCPGDAISAGIRYAADRGVEVINMSLGGELAVASGTNFGPDIQYAWGKGAVIVASSGNSGDEVLSSYAAAPDLVVVGATGPRDERAAYTTGSQNELDIDVFAPGGNGPEGCNVNNCILSTTPKGTYSAYQGTSMAAPHVSGVAALLRCQGHSNQETVDIIKSTADRTSAGLRRVNAAKAVAAKPGGNCGASYEGPEGAEAGSGERTERGAAPTRPTAGAPQPGEGGQAQAPAGQDPGAGYVDPSPSPLAAGAQKKNSGKLYLNLGIAAVLAAIGGGWYMWVRKRQAEG